MKILLLVLAVGVAAFFLSTESMPGQDLREYRDRSYGRITKTVGGNCSVETCVMIYVAPWCPHCRRAGPMIVQLTQQLQAEGVEVNLVIGKDSDSTIEEYAKGYPFPVYADADGSFYEQAKLQGVPSFVVYTNSGDITERKAGYYGSAVAQRKALGI